MGNGDVDKLIEQLKDMFAERERFKKAFFALSMEKQRLDDELGQLKTALSKEGEERAKLVTENSVLSEKATMLEEAARSTAIRADKAQNRVDILETILGRVQDEIYQAINEEDEFVPLEELEQRIEPEPKPEQEAAQDVTEEFLATHPSVDLRELRKDVEQRRVLKDTVLSKLLTLYGLASIGLLVSMFATILHALALSGIYVEPFVRDWTPLNEGEEMAILLVAMFTFMIMLVFEYGVSRVRKAMKRSHSPTETSPTKPIPLAKPITRSGPETPATTEPTEETADDVGFRQQVDEIFGDLDDSGK